jgi:hypothetical protein
VAAVEAAQRTTLSRRGAHRAAPLALAQVRQVRARAVAAVAAARALARSREQATELCRLPRRTCLQASRQAVP